MLTAEIKVNGRLVSVVTIQNVGGDSGPELKGMADYALEMYRAEEWAKELKRPCYGKLMGSGRLLYWDRSRPAHELVHAAIQAIMEGQ